MAWYNVFTKDGFRSAERVASDRLRAQAEDMMENMSFEVKSFDTDSSSVDGSGNNLSGVDQQMSTEVLQRLYASEPWVFAPVSTIAQTIGGLPLKLEKRRQITKQEKNAYTGEMETRKVDVWEDASGEPLYKVFNEPNNFTSLTEWHNLLTIDLETAGEYFIYLDSDQDLDALASLEPEKPGSPFGRLESAMASGIQINGLYRIPPTMIKPVPEKDRKSLAGYHMQSDGASYAFRCSEIIHVKLPNPLDPFRGLSPLVAAFKSVLLDRFSTEHMVRFYKTGARLGGIITTEKALNKEQLGRFQRSFENNFTGRRNHHRTLILPPGMKYQQVEQNPAETALLEFCKHNRETLLAVYRVPPIKVSIMDGANYANARVQLQVFFKDTIQPLLRFIQDGYNVKSAFMPKGNLYRIIFDLSGVDELKEDMSALADTAMKMIKAGLTIDEVREAVWKKQPIPGGDKAFSVAEIEHLDKGGSLGFGALAAPAPEVVKAEVEEDVPSEAGLLSGLSGPQVTSVMNILGRASKGRISAEAAIEILHSIHGLSKDVAYRLLGKTPPCPKCDKEPCQCPQEQPTVKDEAGPKTLAEFMKDSLAALDPSEEVTPDFLNQLLALYHGKDPATHTPEAKVEVAPIAAEQKIEPTPKEYGHGFTKDKVDAIKKDFADRTESMITHRQEVIKGWFKSVKSTVMNRVGANVKAYGLVKARDNDDVNDILSPEGFDNQIREFIKQIDKGLADAFKYGYNDTLVGVDFAKLDEKALEYLKQYAADEVSQIMDTTREQLKALLSESFEQGVAMGEISSRITEKFAEIEEGRAWTIARTEVLTAVSEGQERKVQDFQKEYPEKKLSKMWLSSHKINPREDHADIDGEVVDSDEPFSNGLMYPRDWENGGPDQNCNCGCSKKTFATEDADMVQDGDLEFEGDVNV